MDDEEYEGYDVPADDYDFRGDNPVISDLIAQAQVGDVAGFVDSARSITQFERLDMMVWALIGIMALNAISNLIRRTGDASRPVIEVVAEKMRDGGDRPLQ